MFDALAPSCSVCPSLGLRQEKGRDEHDSRDQLTDFTPTVRLEMIVPASLAEEVLSTIFEAAHTGSRGDGKIYVLPVSDALRIKTGARGKSAV